MSEDLEELKIKYMNLKQKYSMLSFNLKKARERSGHANSMSEQFSNYGDWQSDGILKNNENSLNNQVETLELQLRDVITEIELTEHKFSKIDGGKEALDTIDQEILERKKLVENIKKKKESTRSKLGFLSKFRRKKN